MRPSPTSTLEHQFTLSSKKGTTILTLRSRMPFARGLVVMRTHLDNRLCSTLLPQTGKIKKNNSLWCYSSLSLSLSPPPPLTCRTKIAEPAMLWLDTYFEWIAPKSTCCGVSREDGDGECYDPKWQNDSCDTCKTSTEFGNRPNKTEFGTYLDWFLHDNPGTACPSGGHAAFGGAVVVNKTHSGGRNITTALSEFFTIHVDQTKKYMEMVVIHRNCFLHIHNL